MGGVSERFLKLQHVLGGNAGLADGLFDAADIGL
jgi:hypothetical protein